MDGKVNFGSFSGSNFNDYNSKLSNLSNVTSIKVNSLNNNDPFELWSDKKTEILDLSINGVDFIKTDVSKKSYGDMVLSTTGAVYSERNYYDITDGENWKDFGSELLDNTKKCGATIATAGISIIEGAGLFGEALIDGVTLIGTGLCSIVTGIVDGVGYLVKGNEWDSLTEYMWDRTQNYVQTERMKDAMDIFYDGTDAGTALKENSWGFETTRSVGSGVGYTLGVVGISVLTMGLGGAMMASGATAGGAATVSSTMGVFAGLGGYGKGTEEAWNNGATQVEGIVSGSLSGAWEGLQFYVGGQINGLAPFKNEIANIGLRVGLDAVDGGLEGFVRPGIDTIYKDGYYDDSGSYVSFETDYSLWDKYVQNFDDAGGFSNVGTNFLMGAGMSLFGEMSGMGKKVLNNGVSDIDVSKVDISESVKFRDLTDTEIEIKMEEYNKLIDSDSRLSGIISSADEGHAIMIPDDLSDTYKRLRELEWQINNSKSKIDDSFNNKINIDGSSIENLLSRYEQLQGIILSEDYLLYKNSGSPTGFYSGIEKELAQIELKLSKNIDKNVDFDSLRYKFIINSFNKLEGFDIDKLNNSIGANHSSIFDSECYKLINNDELNSVANDINSPYYRDLIKKIKDFYGEKFNFVISNDIDFGRKNFTKMSDFILRSDDITLEQIKYFNKYVTEKGYSISNNPIVLENYSQMVKAIELNDWTTGEMIERFKNTFGNYVFPSVIDDRLNNSFKYVTSNKFKDYGLGNAMAFNNGKKSIFNLKYDELFLKSNASHESIHQIGGTGVKNMNFNIGINETITEYLTQIIMGEQYPTLVTGKIYCRYEPAVLRLKNMVDAGMFTNDDLMQAYFVDHNLFRIKNKIKIECNAGSMVDDLFAEFDYAVDGEINVCKMALGEIDNIIKDLISKG